MQIQEFINPIIRKMNLRRALLLLILLFSFATKAWNISNPNEHYFDEIYYGFTAEQYAQGNMKAWVWDFDPPKGFAYTWDHPPTGKLIMSVFVKLFGIHSSSRRLAPLIAGSLLPLIVYLLAGALFPKKDNLALIAAFLTACEGLVLSLSRIALTDTMLTLFISLTLLFLWKRFFLLSAFFFGLSISTKWTGVYLLPLIGLFIVFSQNWSRRRVLKSVAKTFLSVFLFLIVGMGIYLVSYTPLFIHYGFDKFVELHKQMWWYHTNLKATHSFQSAAYLWPINWRPVWFWVNYQKETVANIYAMLNPAIAWGGIIAIVLTIYYAVKTRSTSLTYILAAYFIFWVPWIFSPRIMFLYHYLPSVPFLILCLAFVLDRMLESKKSELKLLSYLYLVAVFGLFVFFFPYWTGIPVANDAVDKFRWLKTWGP